MTATISLALTKIGERWSVKLKSTSPDPSFVRDETYQFTSEDEAREGLYRALLWAEEAQKDGTVQVIEIQGEFTATLTGESPNT